MEPSIDPMIRVCVTVAVALLALVFVIDQLEL